MTQPLQVVSRELLESCALQTPDNIKNTKTTHPIDDRKYYNSLKRDYLLFSI